MSPVEKFLLFFALPTSVLASLIEALVLSRRGGYDWRALRISLVDLFGRLLSNIVLPLSLAGPLVALVWEHRLATVPMNGIGAFLLMFIGQEFFYYWFHRASHRVRWFWGNHSVHHTSTELNLSAAYRFGWLGKLAGSPLFFLPLGWLGFPIDTVLALVALNLFYQFWLHAAWIPKLDWLEGWLNTPSAHRVHHAANAEYLDANYGGVLLVFDRIYGTYVPERDDLPCRYGLAEAVQSRTLVQIEFGRWTAMARDVWSARSPREALGYLLMPPGWRPRGAEEAGTVRVLERIP